MSWCHEGKVRVVETQHFQKRCVDRQFQRSDAVLLLWRGTVIGEPALHPKTGQWTYQVLGEIDGERWIVVVALPEDGDIVLVTVYPKEERR